MLVNLEQIKNYYLKNRGLVIPLCSVVLTLIFLIAIFLADIRYKSERVLIPSQQKSSLGIAEGISGTGFFSSLTGGDSSNDSERFKLMLFSTEISNILFEDKGVQDFLLKDYLADDGSYEYHWNIKDHFTNLFLKLRGEKFNPLVDERFILDHLRERIYLTENRENSVLTITYYGDSSQFAEYLLEKLVAITLSKISDQKKLSADKKINYLEQKMSSSLNNSVKSSLASAYEAELKIKMNADLNIDIYEVVNSSKESYLPSSPNILNLLAIYLIFIFLFPILEKYLFTRFFAKEETE